jgi:hypothetical protein
MTIRLIDLDGVIVPFASDDGPLPGGLLSELVAARLIDETTGRPPQGAITVRADIGGAPRVGFGGIVGVVGVPQDFFVASQNITVVLTVEPEGFLPRNVPLPVTTDPHFPAIYAPPTTIPDVPIHRAPVVIEGRVVQAIAGGTTPLAGAEVRVTGIWRQVPAANVVVPPDPPDLVALDPPLQIDRPAASATLTPLPLTQVVAEQRTLLADVAASAVRLRVSDALGIVAPGTRVAVDAGDGDRLEYGDVILLEAASTPDQPAWITLNVPLARGHRTGAVVRRVTAGAAGAARAVAQEALSLDAVAFLANTGGLSTGDTVAIAGGNPKDEYHRVSLFDVVTDADGYYRLPPLTRVGQVVVRAQAGALAPVDVELRPDYAQSYQRLDFVLT